MAQADGRAVSCLDELGLRQRVRVHIRVGAVRGQDLHGGRGCALDGEHDDTGNVQDPGPRPARAEVQQHQARLGDQDVGRVRVAVHEHNGQV